MGLFSGIGKVLGKVTKAIAPVTSLFTANPWVGTALGAGWDMFSSARANSANQDAALRQMSFQERMSSTAYQRATADMRAAGINPMVAYQQGGASSPSGASETHQPTTARMAQMLALRSQEAQIENLRASTAKTLVEARVIGDQSPYTTLRGRALGTAEGLAKEFKDRLTGGTAKKLTVEQALRKYPELRGK